MPYNIIIGRDDADKKRFGEKGLVFLGKGYVKMGQYTSLSNPIFLDVARSHVILVSGKRGSGKCLDGETLITLSDGSQMPIKNLQNNKEKILSLNNKLKIEEVEKNDFFEREVTKLLKIKLRSGKEIKLTPEHPLLTIKGWQPVQELKIGSRIATPRKFENFGKEIMEEYKIKILSYLIAEGHTRKSWVLFSNGDDLLINDFKESIKKFDKELQVEVHSKPQCYRVANKNNRYSFKENPVKKWLKSLECYGYYSKEKWIPQEVFKLTKENLILFLNRLFSCDGSIYKNESRNGWEVDYSSSSKKLIYQVHSLLLKFGILSKIREKKTKCNGKLFDSYELILNPENTIKFIEAIGFYGEKAKKQEQCLKEIGEIKRNPNIDTIPKEIWETYKPKNWAAIGRFVGYKHPKAMRERVHYSPSRQTLFQIAEAEQNNALYLLATSDIFWDEIVSMEISEGNFKVYDISVPTNHNFVANDIIVHNSYSLGVIAEELTSLPAEEKANIAGLIFDTMGIFWTMKYENEKEKELLKEWNLKPRKTPVRVFVPSGYVEDYSSRGLPIDSSFSINPAELEAEDWLLTFNLKMTEQEAVLIQRVISEMKEEKKSFSIEEIIEKIMKEESNEEIKNSTIALFQAALSWKMFSEKETKISELIEAGKTGILDLSMYSSVGAFNVRALVIGLICRKLFKERMMARKKEEIQAVEHGSDYLSFKQKREMPLVWLFLDEIHEFLPAEGKTPASDALIQLLREGRQPGISMVMATQQPGALARDAITQADIVISHRVTALPDISALNELMQSYLLESIKKQMDNLPNLKGSAIILDDNSERIYPMRVRPKFTWHGGEAPTSVKVEKRI